MTMKPDDTVFIDRAAAAWQEFKLDAWRAYAPRSSRAADQKRLFAIVYAADWQGTIGQRMERLLTLLPRAIEQAARSPAFSSARTTLWSVCRSAAGVARLAGGIVPGECGRGWDAGVYDQQILRLRLEADTIAFVTAEAVNQGLSRSALVSKIVECWIEQSIAVEDSAG